MALTAFVLIVILGATARTALARFTPIAIGLALTRVHLASIPLTHTSVRPARSTAAPTSGATQNSQSCARAGPSA